MRLLNIIPPLFFVLLTWGYTCAQPAAAYLDPGTGSMVIQILIGAIFGALATIRIWWGKVAALIKPKAK